jgi:hypothetical protein
VYFVCSTVVAGIGGLLFAVRGTGVSPTGTSGA